MPCLLPRAQLKSHPPALSLLLLCKDLALGQSGEEKEETPGAEAFGEDFTGNDPEVWVETDVLRST